MRRCRFFYLILLSLFTLIHATEGKSQIADMGYETYCNSKFGFCVDYPSKILIPQGESGSGDGQVFASKDNENTLTAYRDFRDNMDPDVAFDISTTYAHDTDTTHARVKKTVTYKRLGKTFYVISGYQNGKIYYQKTILSDGQLFTCIMVYKASEKQLYNKLSEHVFKSFK